MDSLTFTLLILGLLPADDSSIVHLAEKCEDSNMDIDPWIQLLSLNDKLDIDKAQKEIRKKYNFISDNNWNEKIALSQALDSIYLKKETPESEMYNMLMNHAEENWKAKNDAAWREYKIKLWVIVINFLRNR